MPYERGNTMKNGKKMLSIVLLALGLLIPATTLQAGSKGGLAKKIVAADLTFGAVIELTSGESYEVLQAPHSHPGLSKDRIIVRLRRGENITTRRVSELLPKIKKVTSWSADDPAYKAALKRVDS
jgi:hypothetical protein